MLICGALIVAVGGGWHFLNRQDNGAPQFQTVAVTRGELTQAVTATGTLNPVVNVTVGSQISGIIQKLSADFNTMVTNGQVIAQLDPATYQANVMSAEADLANSRAQLELAQLNARRAEELFKNNLVAKSEFDQTLAALHQAEAQVQIKNATLNRTKVDLGRCTIYAPVDGIVIDRKVDVGQTVAASMSAPVLFQIANDLSKMQIDANVSEADIGTVEEGQAVNFLVDAFPGRNFPGKVVQIRNSPITVQNVVTYDTVIEVANPDLKLKPGMTANVSIITAQRPGALKISNAAFRFKPADALTNLVVAAAKATNAAPAVAGSGNLLTGNETPEELQKRASQMRERGEEVPADIRNKLRELYQSGVLQRPLGSGRHGEGVGPRANASQATTHTVYVLGSDPSGSPVLHQLRIKTGISDGVTTEVIEGLSEGDKVVTGVTLANASSAGANNPFGGGMMPRR